jgi:hypothetical protein
MSEEGRMGRIMRLAIVGVLVVLASAPAATAPAADKLTGTTWHTVRIDGDALFFVIRDVGVRFEDGGRFVAAVRYIDGQQTSRTGTYRLARADTLVVTIDGLGKPKTLALRRQGKDLVIQDKAFDVTVRLAPGKMEEEHWF